MGKFDNLIKHLNSIKEDSFQLSIDQIGKELGGLAKIYTQNNSSDFTERTPLGKAILSAGYIFSRSKKDGKPTFEFKKNKQDADKHLEIINVGESDVILNVVFPTTAGYFKSQDNIGHEIIDIFGADKGEFHYYLNPWGLTGSNQLPKAVLSISRVSTRIYKVLNKAVGLSIDEGAGEKKTNKEDLIGKYQTNKFLYNGKPLEEYFSSNSGGSKVLSTFKCEGIYEPKKPIYLVFNSSGKAKQKFGDGVYELVSNNCQAQTTKFVKFNKADREMLKNLVDNEELWKTETIDSFEKYVKEHKKNDDFNYFKELGIEDQELQYSNAIRCFLERYDLIKPFLKCLGCDVKENEKFSVEREKYNIDLFFTNFNHLKRSESIDDERIVIVENKIKAGITPTDNDKGMEEQVEKIFRRFKGIKDDEGFNKEKEELKNLKERLQGIDDHYCENDPSQLSKYYIYAVLLAQERGWSLDKMKKDIKCFFLCPEYSKVLYELSNDGRLQNNTLVGKDNPLSFQERYKLVSYRDIHGLFAGCLAKLKKDNSYYFLSDFVKSLKDLGKEMDDSLKTRMIEMFYRRSLP